MYFRTPDEILGYCCLFLTCGYAIWRGGAPERWAALLIVSDWVLTPLIGNHDAFRHAQTNVFVMDGGLALALLCMALYTDRFWPIWVTAFQILELLMHAAMLIDHRVGARAYFVGIEISSYLMLFALAAGVWLERPEQRRISLSAAGHRRRSVR